MLGAESIGRLVAIGEGVAGLGIGDRVGCANGAGAYATAPGDRRGSRGEYPG